MTPQPPTTTLFPYTTLFRSQRPQRPEYPQFPCLRSCFCDAELQFPGLLARLLEREDASVEKRNQVKRRCHEDRKSTRLNSSHVEISYAVFCLKKKRLTMRLM